MNALAQLLEQHGKSDEAREHLTSICGTAADGLDSLELDTARRHLQTVR